MEGDESACEENDESGSEPDGSNSESENEGIVQDKSGDVDEQKISKSKERTCKPNASYLGLKGSALCLTVTRLLYTSRGI